MRTILMCLAVASLSGTDVALANPDPLREPRGGAFLPDSMVSELGVQAFDQLKRSKTISRDPKLRGQVSRVLKRLVAHVDAGVASWEFVIIDDPAPNAFALPGGKIGVHSGLFPVARSDAGLAAVLSHEIAHVSLRHGAKRMQTQMGSELLRGLAGQVAGDPRVGDLFGAGTGVASLSFSRKHELEADRVGLKYMALAGYDPAEALGFWERMRQASGRTSAPIEFLSTHPADARRMAQLEELIPEARRYLRGRN